MLISLESYVLSFWFNAGDWKLVPDPFMMLLKRQIAKSGHFPYLTFDIFKCSLFTFSK